MSQVVARILEPEFQVFVASAIADADIQSYAAVEIPVLAFHEDGISSVQWQWSDGTNTVTVSSSTPETITKYTSLDANVAGSVGGKNLRFKAWGFTKTADLSALANGQLTLTVTATPGGSGNTARVLTATFFKKSSVVGPYYVSTTGNDANDGLSAASPVKEILKAVKLAYTAGGNDSSGALIYLMDGAHDPGNYSWGAYQYLQAKTGFLTIANRAANTTRAVIAKTGSTWSVSDQLNWARFVGVGNNNTFVDMSNNATYLNRIWWQGAEIYSTSRDSVPNAAGWFDGVLDNKYMTECYVHQTGEAAKGVELVRNLEFFDIGGDVCFEPNIVCNLQGSDCYTSAGGTDHTDLVQFGNGKAISNVVICSLRCTNSKDQALFFSTTIEVTETVTDVAIVNVANHVNMSLGATVFPYSQWDGKQSADPAGGMHVNHVITAFTTLTNKDESTGAFRPGYIWDIDKASSAGNVVKNNCWAVLSSGKTDSAGLSSIGTWNKNHALDSTSLTPGTNFTTGATGFTDVANADLRPATGSVLKASGESLPACFSPPGSDGVGDAANPNIGAWGDAAGAGFSGGTYSAGGGGGSGGASPLGEISSRRTRRFYDED